MNIFFNFSLHLTLMLFVCYKSSSLKQSDPGEYACQDYFGGNAPHPYICRLYYQCYPYSKPVLHMCPLDYLFDELIESCKPADQVPACQGGSPPPPTTTTQIYPTTTNPIEWICEDGFNGFIRHPYDCQFLYWCKPNNPPLLIMCENDYYFNQTTKTCDFQKNVSDCQETPLPLNLPNDYNNQLVCQVDDYMTRPHPYNCRLFYQCYPYSLPLLKMCQLDFYFDESQQRCRPHDEVPLCQGGSPPPPTTTTQIYPTTANPIEWICPNNFDGYIRHPYDCQFLYLCNSTNVPVLIRCGFDYYFSTISETCVEPKNVNDCQDGRPPTLSTTTQVSSTTTKESSTTSDPIDWICPEGYHGLIRHPFKCHAFYLCNIRETPYLLECSSALYFNPETKRCDFPENVSDCRGGSPPPPTTTEASTTTSDPISWICPEGYQGLIRHPFDCHSFYLCNVDPTPYLLECPLGLYFNPKTEKCDLPDNVPDCQQGSPSPGTPTPRSTTKRTN